MLGGLAVVAIVAAACSSSERRRRPAARRRASGAAGSYNIGFANGGGVGNGWRESSICSVKAQAVASGQVDKVTVINHDTDAAGQLTDIRDLIAAGRRRDHHQPERSGRAEPGDRRGHRGRHHGHRGRRVRHRRGRLQPVQRPGRVRLPRRQVPCSSRWARRAPSSTCAASPATRPTPTATPGFKKALAEYPGHHGRQGTRDQVGSGDGRQPDQRHHEQRRDLRRHLDVRRRLVHRRRA